MITLFRRIRQKLIDSGSISKYLLYAVGEIALVMIGILLALQVNNWNEENKRYGEESKILSKLITDLKADQDYISEIQSSYAKQLDSLITFKAIIYKKSHTQADINRLENFTGAVIMELNPRTNSYREMINSGKLYNLSDDELAESISEYYRQLENQIYLNRQTRNEFRALFYGPDLTDFWYWRAKTDNSLDAIQFFSSKDTNAYKLLMQSAGWSVYIIRDKIVANDQILNANTALIGLIEAELAER